MTTSGRTRDAPHARVRCGRLLLFAALLLGIATMHTLGHPSGHGEDGGRGPVPVSYAAHAAGAAAGAGAGHRDGQMVPPSGHRTELPASTAGHRAALPTSVGDETVAPGMPPMQGMDPLAVCLAVLGAFTLLLLLAVAWSGGPWSGDVRPPVPGRLLHALRPEAPPPRKLLTCLSVLRI